MARTARDTKLDSRTARAKLPARHAPYWTHLDRGVELGYRKGARGGTWLAFYRDDATGARSQEKIGKADDAMEADERSVLTFGQARRAVLAWCTRKAREVAGEAEAIPNGYNVGHALDEYMAWFRQHRKGARETELAIEAHVRPALGAIEVARLTTGRIREWHAALAASPARLRTRPGATQRYRESAAPGGDPRPRKATANRVLTILKAALSHAFNEGRVSDDSAWRKAKPFRGADAARLRYLSHDECRRLVNACEPDFRRLVTAALMSGCRYGELARLKAGDFNADAGTLIIHEAKGGRPRHIPLDAEGRAFFTTLAAGKAPSEMLLPRHDGRPWGKAHQSRPLSEASKVARIEPETNFHALRHTWASHRVMAGAPLIVVASVLGHGDTRMVERHYGHLSPSFIRDAIERSSLNLDIATGEVVPLTAKR